MKTKIFTLLLLSCFIGLGQNNQEKRIDIDVESTVFNKKTIVNPGKFKIVLLNYNPNKSYNVDIQKDNHKYEPLNFPADTTANKILNITEDEKVIETITINQGQDLSVKIEVFVTSENSDKKKETIKEKTYSYKFKTERKGSWQTNFGFNFISLGNKDSFFSKQIDSTYTITKGTNQNKLDFHPSIMFTWVPNTLKNIKVGYSGGFGYDLDNSLSAFAGISVIFSQNITFSTGLAFHNQKLLNSKYKEGDVLKENLTFDQLHTDYIRFNPFVSIAFRLDKSPF